MTRSRSWVSTGPGSTFPDREPKRTAVLLPSPYHRGQSESTSRARRRESEPSVGSLTGGGEKTRSRRSVQIDQEGTAGMDERSLQVVPALEVLGTDPVRPGNFPEAITRLDDVQAEVRGGAVVPGFFGGGGPRGGQGRGPGGGGGGRPARPRAGGGGLGAWRKTALLRGGRLRREPAWGGVSSRLSSGFRSRS